ncbi:MAG: phosphoenolpyruvate mutase [Cyanobacteria bacterium]|nr:phosphoenolpyruvate mutase [Cyanobacteriota bacterium]
MKPTVYVGMSADILHHGHINILETAAQYGDIVIGLLTDQAISQYKRLPYLTYNQREKILSNIKGVVQVIPQNQWDYSPTLRQLKPHFMIHGDDWCQGPQTKYRDKAYEAMGEWGGQIIEIPYTPGISSSQLEMENRHSLHSPQIRLGLLKRLLDSKALVRILEVHDPLSASIPETLTVEMNDSVASFDCMWSSSLADSAIRFKPDSESIDISQRLTMIDAIFDVTSKPLIFDFDTGRKIEHIPQAIHSLERLGVSAVVMEDKTGFKQNSLGANSRNEIQQTQENVETFSKKIMTCVQARNYEHFLIFARIESLILGKGMEDALARSHSYLEAGADGIIIHSKQTSSLEIFEFTDAFRDLHPKAYLGVIPTMYPCVSEIEIINHKINLVIYANHLIRAAYPAMKACAKSILTHQRALEAEDLCIPFQSFLSLFP